MKSIRSKLSNSRGVSMIIAMVFMMICLFVGATVLTAASMNTERIRSHPKKQVFMNERSAAMLVADNLEVPCKKTKIVEGVAKEEIVNEPIYIKVYEQRLQEKPIQVKPNGEVVIPDGPFTVDTDTVRFEVVYPDDAVEPMTALQRAMIENTILNYIKHPSKAQGSEESVPINPLIQAVTVDNFLYGGEAVTYDKMWYKYNPDATLYGGSIEFDRPDLAADDPGKTFTANFKSDTRSERNFDFIADFGDFSQLDVIMYATTGVTYVPRTVEIDKDLKKVTYTDTTLTVISWADPLIVKGDNA